MSIANVFLIGGSLLMGLGTAPALAQDAENGRVVYEVRCKRCHTTEAGGAHGKGPNLHGIFGRRIASVDFPRSSRTFRELEFTWDEEKLSGFIENPRANLPGTIMRSSGVDDPGELADLIAYLKEATASK